MPRYLYKALSSAGETMEGEMEAPAKHIVIERLQESGHLPIRATELNGRRAGRIRGGGRKRISNRDVTNFTRELATMLNAGLTLDHALETLINLSATRPLRQMLERVRTSVQAGGTLSMALQQEGNTFNLFYLNMVRAGEAAGALELILTRLTDYKKRSAELRESVIGALIYPVILVCAAAAAMVILLIFVVPQFTPLFEDMGAALPLSTQIVVGLAHLLVDYWWLLLFALGATVWFVHTQYAEPASRRRWDAMFLRTPLLADLISKVEVARFSRTLGTLIGNGVPLLTGVGIVRETLSNQVLAEAMEGVSVSLEQGRGLAKPLADAGCFPELAVQLVQVGEDTGQLGTMLDKLADVYDAEVRFAVKRTIAILEPALILGMGLVIAGIIISILLAILALNDFVV